MIKELTAEQQARFPYYVNKWTAIGRCTDKADRPRAEAAIALMYKAGGLEPPKQIIWSESPRAQLVLYNIYETNNEEKYNNGLLNMKKFLKETKINTNVNTFYAQHEAAWMSYYDFFLQEFPELEETIAPLMGLMELTQSAGWCIPTDVICFVSERHTTLCLDEAGLLHNETGMAYSYPDGWGGYYWHGVEVPADWILKKDKLTVTKIFKETNAEKRRAGCNIIGWDKVLEGIDAKLVDEDGDPQVGTLYKGQIPGATACGFLKVLCGTGRTFVIPVPSSVNTAIEAQTWIDPGALNYSKTWEKPEVRG